MGLRDRFKKIFSSDKNDDHNLKSDDISEVSETIDSSFDELKCVLEQSAEDVEDDDSLQYENALNFKYLDGLIHGDDVKISLDSDIVLDDDERMEYVDGIVLDVCNMEIDANGHVIDACSTARIFRVIAKNVTLNFPVL